MKGKKSKRENSRSVSVYPAKRKIKIVSTRFGLSLYSAQISKNTKIPSIPIIHVGKNGKKKSQKGSQTRVKRTKNQKAFSH